MGIFDSIGKGFSSIEKKVEGPIKSIVKSGEKTISSVAKEGKKGISTVYKDVIKKPLDVVEKSTLNLSGGFSKALSSPITFIAIGLVAVVLISKK